MYNLMNVHLLKIKLNIYSTYVYVELHMYIFNMFYYITFIKIILQTITNMPWNYLQYKIINIFNIDIYNLLSINTNTIFTMFFAYGSEIETLLIAL